MFKTIANLKMKQNQSEDWEKVTIYHKEQKNIYINVKIL